MPVLEERQSVHGDFGENAETAQGLKLMIKDAVNFHRLDADMVESLDLICTKLSRIVTGDCNYQDHWLDIAGYATLISDRLKEKT